MDAEPPFVADGEATEAVEPSEGALNHPPVAAESLAGLDAAVGDMRLDAAVAAGAATAPAGDGRNGVQQLFDRRAVVNVGPGQEERKRDTLSAGDKMALGAGSAAVRRKPEERASLLMNQSRSEYKDFERHSKPIRNRL